MRQYETINLVSGLTSKRGSTIPMSDKIEFSRVGSDDVESLLRLKRSIFDSGRATEAWFEWKYGSVSALDGLPVTVARTDDGEIVGAIGYLALRYVVEGEQVLGIQPADVMVNPEYRHLNTFNQLVNVAREQFYPEKGWLEFGWPGPNTVDIWTRLQGWDEVCEWRGQYRIQHPSKFLLDSDAPREIALLTTAANLPYRMWLRVRDRLRISPPGGYEVTRHENPPLDILTSLYDRHVPNRLHAIRDRAFYETRLEAPDVTYRTYVARSGGEMSAAIIVSQQQPEQVATLVDLLPLDATDTRTGDAIEAILVRILADYDEAKAIEYSPVLSEDLAERFGFHTRDLISGIARSERTPEVLEEVDRTFDDRMFGVETSAAEELPADVTEYDNWWLAGIERDDR